MNLTGIRRFGQKAIQSTGRRPERLLDSPGGCWQLKGFDLAGEEASCPAGAVRENLLPLMGKCMHITIHAGENVDVKSIWEAVYHLNAERIGQGLTLWGNPELMKRFIDKNIAVEMCLSSNFQIAGYRDNYLPETQKQKIYPLKAYLDQESKLRSIRITPAFPEPI